MRAWSVRRGRHKAAGTCGAPGPYPGPTHMHPKSINAGPLGGSRDEGMRLVQRGPGLKALGM